MLIQIALLGIVIVGIIFAGAKLGSKIKELEVQVFFWILYGVSIFTFFLMLLCGYIYYTFRKKIGSMGPRGFQGNPGKQGDPGTCDQNLCRSRTLSILLEKIIEKHNKKPVSSEIKNRICGYFNAAPPSGSSDLTKNSEKLKFWNLMDVKVYRDIFTQQVSFIDGEVKESDLANIFNNSQGKFNQINPNDNTKNLNQYNNDTNTGKCV